MRTAVLLGRAQPEGRKDVVAGEEREARVALVQRSPYAVEGVCLQHTRTCVCVCVILHFALLCSAAGAGAGAGAAPLPGSLAQLSHSDTALCCGANQPRPASTSL